MSNLRASTGSPVLDDIAELIGVEAAMELAYVFLGERLYIPKDPATEPKIAETIGEENARLLCSAKWRTHVQIPRQIVLRHKVVQMAEAGARKIEIVRETRLGERHVYQILARHREAESNKSQMQLL